MKEKTIVKRKIFISLVNYKAVDLTINCIESICNSLQSCNVFVSVNIYCCDVSEDESKTFKETNLRLHKLGFKALCGDEFMYQKNGRSVFFNHHRKPNLGFGYGNNRNFEKIKAEASENDIIWILNNDTLIGVHSLSEIEAAFKLDDSVIYGCTLIKESTGKIQCLGGTNEITWRSQGSLIAENEAIESVLDSYSDINGYVNGASMLMTYDTLSQVKGFDESYFMWCEEVDFCLRAKSLNILFKNICKAHIVHRVGGSSEGNNIKYFLGRSSDRNTLPRFIIRYYYNYRNRIYLIRKFFPNKLIFSLMYLASDAVTKSVGVMLYDDKKLMRLFLLLKAFNDGVRNKLGKTIEPQDYNE
ncbi:glycosyltransferase family 2 protein [Pseudoalteromonas sp. MEBiC 03485]|uniref:glycosyltransferase family 2 protein n=1 Tax=Pseudoalteromonas sp. MEBiC 03485 TaxID=2571103 RepID=UPI00102018C5|nr:glycosyltransferase family 2 protein [Pseudoalteromonas sp. MEBiC 03485]RZD21694.1 glycosyltransferase family 2 protein [Pseudoalteromonas sp. MEBiC 03485]